MYSEKYDIAFDEIDLVMREVVKEIDIDGSVVKVKSKLGELFVDYHCQIRNDVHFIQVKFLQYGTVQLLFGHKFCRDTKEEIMITISSLIKKECYKGYQSYNLLTLEDLDTVYPNPYNIFDLETEFEMFASITHGSELCRNLNPKIQKSIELFILKFFLFKGISIRSVNLYVYFEKPFNKRYRLTAECKTYISNAQTISLLEALFTNLHNESVVYRIVYIDENGNEIFTAKDLAKSMLILTRKLINQISVLEFCRPNLSCLRKKVHQDSVELKGLSLKDVSTMTRTAVKKFDRFGKFKMTSDPKNESIKYLLCRASNDETVIMVTIRDDDCVEVKYNIYFPYSGRKDYLAGLIIKHVTEMLTNKRYPAVLSDYIPIIITNDLKDMIPNVDVNCQSKNNEWVKYIEKYIVTYLSTCCSSHKTNEPRMVDDFFTVSGKMDVYLMDDYRYYLKNVEDIFLIEDLYLLLSQYNRIYKYFNEELVGVDSDITRELNKVYIGISIKLMNQVGFCK